MKYFLFSIITTLIITSCTAKQEINCVGGKGSDLITLLKHNDIEVNEYNSIDEMLLKIKNNSSAMILSDEYPIKGVRLTKNQIEKIQQKNIKLFCEYLSGDKDSIVVMDLERAVVVDSLSDKLYKNSLMSLNRCHVQYHINDNEIISFAKVAGFDNAVYGLENTKTYPFLFKENDILISSTKLSHFAQARYVPESRVKALLEYIISYVCNSPIELKSYVSFVTPTYTKYEVLNKDARLNSIIKGCEWFYNGNLLVDSSWKESWVDKHIGDGTMPVGPQIDLLLPDGDGSCGVLEGHMSGIDWDGNQSYRYWLRDDVQGESSYAFAIGYLFSNNPQYKKVAKNLNNYSFKEYRDGVRNDPSSPTYGLLGWAVTAKQTYYGDDNARSILGTIGSASILKDNSWDKYIAECIIGNFRTTGAKGFRGERLIDEDIQKRGWKSYYNDTTVVNPHPHFEAWNWACYLWLYHKTGYQPLLERAKKGISITMDSYPSNWKWTNGIQQERARMILPLAWLVRVEPTTKHREWLDFMVEELLLNQTECGGIREELGNPNSGMFGATKSNDEYGMHEAPLIFNNGDPVCDMLYTTNFAFASLNEAARATNNPKYIESVERMSNFLTRIQVKSERYKGLDGAWFRAFNYENWDYWASNADAGWGAWSTLTGWIQSWIVATQGLVEMETSLWDISQDSNISESANDVINKMM